jgi:hypothetical protein
MAIIAVIVGVFSIVVIAVSLQNNNSRQNHNGVSGLVSQPVASVLPTRDDGVETEWKMESITNNPEQFISPEYSPKGFSEATQVFFYKNEIFVPDSAVRITAYKYTSIEDSTKEYANLVAKVREVGGFTERKASDLGATCYSTLNTGSGTYNIHSYCVKSNVYYEVAGDSIDISVIDKFTNIIADRITNFSRISDTLTT